MSEICYSSLENKWEEMQSSRTWQEVIFQCNLLIVFNKTLIYTHGV